MTRGKRGNPHMTAGAVIKGAGIGVSRALNSNKLARMVAFETNDGQEILDRMLVLARLEPTTPERARVALAALEWLSDRWAGKAPQHIDVTAQVSHVHTVAGIDLAAIEALDDAEADRLETSIRGLLATVTADTIDAEIVDEG